MQSVVHKLGNICSEIQRLFKVPPPFHILTCCARIKRSYPPREHTPPPASPRWVCLLGILQRAPQKQVGGRPALGGLVPHSCTLLRRDKSAYVSYRSSFWLGIFCCDCTQWSASLAAAIQKSRLQNKGRGCDDPMRAGVLWNEKELKKPH